MNLIANRRVRVIENQVIYIKRQLPKPGQILVSQGHEVSPADIIGHSTVSAGFRTVNLAKQLNVSPKDAQRYLQRQISQKIYKGELLAYKKGGLLSKEKLIVSPLDGVVDFFDEQTGNLRISYLPHMVDLPAAVYGVVEQIDENKSEVLIKTQATQVYGMLGSGRSREGTLNILGNRSDLTDRERISKLNANHILVSGGLIYAGALAQAISSGVHGIITGGINGSDFKNIRGGRLIVPGNLGNDIGLSLIVCEGFGSIPIGEDIFSVLQKFNNQFAIIDGNGTRITLPSCESGCIINIRKVTLPPSAREKFTDPTPETSAIPLEVGQKVRVVASRYMGEQGIITAIDGTVTMLESKINTYLVTITNKSRKIKVPYLNLEIIQ
jgi:hypothetical protein